MPLGVFSKALERGGSFLKFFVLRLRKETDVIWVLLPLLPHLFIYFSTTPHFSPLRGSAHDHMRVLALNAQQSVRGLNSKIKRREQKTKGSFHQSQMSQERSLGQAEV